MPDSTQASDAQTARDLSQRFIVQVRFPDVTEERWDSINSYPTLMDAVRACSDCFETVRMLFGMTQELSRQPLDFELRIWDGKDKEVAVFEDADGALHCCKEELLENDSEPSEED